MMDLMKMIADEYFKGDTATLNPPAVKAAHKAIEAFVSSLELPQTVILELDALIVKYAMETETNGLINGVRLGMAIRDL